MAVVHCTKRNEAVEVTSTAVTTTGIGLDAQEHGDRMLLLLNATAACTITVVAGDAEVFGGLEDLKITFGSAGSKVVCLDTARFKFVSGENKGKILVKADSAGKATASMLIAC